MDLVNTQHERDNFSGFNDKTFLNIQAKTAFDHQLSNQKQATENHCLLLRLDRQIRKID
jgi:hypothetical protein